MTHIRTIIAKQDKVVLALVGCVNVVPGGVGDNGPFAPDPPATSRPNVWWR